MIRYYLRKLLVFVLSMAIAVSLILFSFSVLSVGLFHSDDYIESGLKRNSDAIIQEINSQLELAANRLSVPSEMLVDSVNSENINIITGEVAHNFIYGYATAFSNSTELYGVISSSVSQYASEHGMRISDIEVNRISSLAVDYVNEAVGSSDTANVSAFSFVRGRLMMIIISACIIIAVGSIIALDFLNRGRHRKFNYIGMGTTTAGAVIVVSNLAINYKGYLSQYRFCSFDAYNSALQYCFSNLYKYFFAIGVLYLIIGLVMLVVNYNYFRRKKEAHLATRLTVDDTLTDYMENYYEKNTRTHVPGEEFEKDIKKIDFEEEKGE